MQITKDTRFRPVAQPLSMATARGEVQAAWREWHKGHPDATKVDAEDYITEAGKAAIADPSMDRVRREVGGRDQDVLDWVASVIIDAGAIAVLED